MITNMDDIKLSYGDNFMLCYLKNLFIQHFANRFLFHFYFENHFNVVLILNLTICFNGDGM